MGSQAKFLDPHPRCVAVIPVVRDNFRSAVAGHRRATGSRTTVGGDVHDLFHLVCQRGAAVLEFADLCFRIGRTLPVFVADLLLALPIQSQ